MKIFLSWSGLQSRAVAQALHELLPLMMQAVEVFFSPDIEKGARWSGEIDSALEGTSFGLVCLTPDNLNSNWIHFETGALSKTPDARIWTFLLDLQPAEVPQPLGKFQHTEALKEEDVRKLVRTINSRLPDPLDDARLTRLFDLVWPQLQQRLQEARASAPKAEAVVPAGGDVRDPQSMFSEILEILRVQDRRLRLIETRVDRVWRQNGDSSFRRRLINAAQGDANESWLNAGKRMVEQDEATSQFMERVSHWVGRRSMRVVSAAAEPQVQISAVIALLHVPASKALIAIRDLASVLDGKTSTRGELPDYTIIEIELTEPRSATYLQHVLFGLTPHLITIALLERHDPSTASDGSSAESEAEEPPVVALE